MKMHRVRFMTTSVDDPRPVKFPPPGPYWHTGYSGDDHAVIVAYVPEVGQIKEYWPEAESLDVHAIEEPVFTDRFPKPEWWK